MTAREAVLEALDYALDLDAWKIQDDQTFADLGATSLSCMSIALSVEEDLEMSTRRLEPALDETVGSYVKRVARAYARHLLTIPLE